MTDRFRQGFKVSGSRLVTASMEAFNIPSLILIVIAALGLAGIIYRIRPPPNRANPPLGPPMEADETYPLPPLR